MATIKRPLTETEWAAVKAALPSHMKPMMDGIISIKTNCWTCDHYDGFEGQPGKCLNHDIAIPNDERGKSQECWEYRLIPF